MYYGSGDLLNKGSEKYKFAKNLRWHSYSRMHYANHQVWKVSTEFRYLYFHSIICILSTWYAYPYPGTRTRVRVPVCITYPGYPYQVLLYYA